MILSLKTVLILLLLAFLAGLVLFTPITTTITNFLNGVSNALSPIGSAVNATSDNSLCQHAGIGCLTHLYIISIMSRYTSDTICHAGGRKDEVAVNLDILR